MKQIFITFLFIPALFLAACSASQSSTPTPFPTPESTPTPVQDELPVFPGAEEINTWDYHYTIQKADVLTVQRFYKEQMQVVGWKLIGIGDMSGADIGEAYALWFTKGEETASVDIFMKEDLTHVVIRLNSW